ncbi:maleylpyruvate isomerase family mycothiol-dependent enzyme [Streptomyces malaysiensis]|uniref:maleylpyruvate isomerase family mycothiol-dependent enzyme n=1 Tax=Streptomyces malaysiensis TaxID=92644 RepID=UPI002B2DB331|nr:maleylpyruvate isomerase family mycothiol-dependent enzyme [Streptomyces malaysiensis]
MTAPAPAGAATDWALAGERFFAARLAAVDDSALRAPSGLPGWTRAHVAGHVARNADALVNLAEWARTGVERPMYPDPDARRRGIEEAAAQPAARLRADVAESASRLARVWAALPADSWQTPVRSALGRAIPLVETVWMRVREVWVHGIDLRGDGRFDELPPGLVDALVTETVDILTGRGAPAVELVPTDRPAAWRLGGGVPTSSVTAPAHRLLGWLVGRSTPPGLGPTPALPGWL